MLLTVAFIQPCDFLFSSLTTEDLGIFGVRQSWLLVTLRTHNTEDTMRICYGLEIYKASHWRWAPDAGFSPSNRSFAAAFHLYWLWFAIDYAHISKRWMEQKASVD